MVKKLMHRKLVSIAIMLTMFGSIGAISWAIVNSHAQPEISTQELARDAVMAYIESNHIEAAPFLNDLIWIGGREESNLLGAETYVYLSGGWTVTIKYPVIADPAYQITADYSSQSTGGIGIPYRLIWEGIWEDGSVSETSFNFAQ
jgi:hypothetical protein